LGRQNAGRDARMAGSDFACWASHQSLSLAVSGQIHSSPGFDCRITRARCDMTRASDPEPRRPDLIQRIAAVVTLEAPLNKLDRWLRRKLKVGTYELRAGEIIAGRGRRPQSRIRVEDIRDWQIGPEMLFDIVTIKLADGRVLTWLVEFDDLIAILRSVAADRELIS
jgi:hypothetical protein